MSEAERYTTDAVGFIRYLVGSLGTEAERIYSAAEEGDAMLELPAINAAEALYLIQKGHPAKGETLPLDAPEVADRLRQQAFPVEVVPVTTAELGVVATARGTFSLHDAMLVASHRVRETTAIATTDTTIDDEGVAVVWD